MIKPGAENPLPAEVTGAAPVRLRSIRLSMEDREDQRRAEQGLPPVSRPIYRTVAERQLAFERISGGHRISGRFSSLKIR